MSRLHEIGQWAFNTAPPIAEMRGHPEFESWGEQLVALGRSEGLAPLQNLLEDIVGDALTTLNPLNRFLGQQAHILPLDTYWRASDVAERALPKSPHAAFLLSLVSMLGWASALGERLYQQYNGMPDRGWVRIPYVCALTSLKIEAVEGAKNLVDESYDTLMAAKYQWDPRLKEALADYRRLAGKIQRKYEMSIANLADDLRESCRPAEHHFRAEVGAILWSLGLIPESQLFRTTDDSNIVPSRRLFRLIVRQSLDCIPHDSLVQYVWLELKDRPPFNIREHKSLFGKINNRYGQLMLDEFYPVPPSQAYARSLIAWFRGDISQEQAAEYLSTYDMIQAMFPQMDWLVYLRMTGLAHMLAKKFDWLPPDTSEQQELERWYYMADLARSVRKNFNQHPEWPKIHSRPNLALFHLIEHEFSKTGSQGVGDPAKVLQAIEQFRTSTLSYWLKVVPPIPSSEEQVRLGHLLQTENELLDYLRGAFFLTLYPILPKHYRRYGMMLEEMIEVRSDPESRRRLDPDVGRQQIKELNDELEALFTKMEEVAPGYARKRLEPTARLENLIHAINSHVVQ